MEVITIKPPIFDNSKKTYQERVGYLSKIIDDSKLTEWQLEKFANYLLDAKDIVSHRKIENRFYISEREYRKYKDNLTINFTDCNMSGMEPLLSKNKAYDQHDTNKVDRIRNLFNPDTITKKERLRILSKFQLITGTIEDDYVLVTVNEIVDGIFDKSSTGLDLVCLNLTIRGFTQTDISNRLKISKVAVHKRLGRLCA